MLSTSAVLAQPPASAAPPVVTRADLAAAYQRVDVWLMQHPLDSATLAQANREFDRSTLAFFGGRTAESVRTLHRLTARLMGDTAADGTLAEVLALRVATASRRVQRGDPRAALRVERILPSTRRTDLNVRLLDARGRQALVGRVSLDSAAADAQMPDADAKLRTLGAGRYDVRARMGTAPEVSLGWIDVVSEDPDSARTRLAAASATLDSAALPHAVSAFRARLQNLVRVPATDNSAQFLANPSELAASLTREAAALQAGRDPYVGRGDDHWRVVVGPGGRPLPVRVIPPPRHTGPLPVIVALHGAGGDENMFPDAYGAGEVVRQAAARGALVLSPATTVFARDPAMLDTLLAVASRSYTLDTTRIYVIGHSAGAAAAYSAVSARPTRIAASVLLAGAGRAPAAPAASGAAVPPSLWMAGELDPVIPPSRIRPAADAARAAGAQVEYRERTGYGHTLIVGPALVDAFTFLFAHRRGAGS